MSEKENITPVMYAGLPRKGWENYIVSASDGSYMILISVRETYRSCLFSLSYADLKIGGFAHVQEKTFRFFKAPYLTGKSQSNTYVTWANKNLRFTRVSREKNLHLLFSCPSLVLPDGRIGLDASLTLIDNHDTTSYRTDITSFSRTYPLGANTYVTGMAVSGTLRLGNKVSRYRPDEASAIEEKGALRKGHSLRLPTRLYASGFHDGTSCTLFLSQPFGRKSSGIGEMCTYNGQVHSLEGAVWHWKEDGRLQVTCPGLKLDIVFHPAFVVSHSSHGKSQPLQRKMFGHITGLVNPTGVTPIPVEGFPGFLEIHPEK